MAFKHAYGAIPRHYRVKVRHAGGSITYTTSASSAKAAVRQVLDMEHAPRGAVMGVSRRRVDASGLPAGGWMKMRKLRTTHRKTR